jgi:hypothetical protein
MDKRKQKLSHKKCPYYGCPSASWSKGTKYCDLYEPKSVNKVRCKQYPCVTAFCG